MEITIQRTRRWYNVCMSEKLTSNPMFTWHVHRWEPGKNVVWTALRVLDHTALNLLLKEHPGAGMQAVEIRRMHATGLAPQYEMEIWAEKSAQWEFCGVLVRVNILSYPCPCHSFIMAPLLQTCELSSMIANREGKKKRPYFGRRIRGTKIWAVKMVLQVDLLQVYGTRWGCPMQNKSQSHSTLLGYRNLDSYLQVACRTIRTKNIYFYYFLACTGSIIPNDLYLI